MRVRVAMMQRALLMPQALLLLWRQAYVYAEIATDFILCRARAMFDFMMLIELYCRRAAPIAALHASMLSGLRREFAATDTLLRLLLELAADSAMRASSAHVTLLDAASCCCYICAR